jgi:hypothetical protein
MGELLAIDVGVSVPFAFGAMDAHAAMRSIGLCADES